MNQRFKLLFKEKGYGMRFFSDSRAPGRIAVADNSGPTPDQTDDGVLYVDPSRPMEPYVSHKSYAVSYYAVSFGVVNPQGDKFGCDCSLDGAIFLLTDAMMVAAGLTCKVDTHLYKLMQLVNTQPERPSLRCPNCNNEDLDTIQFLENVLSYRRLHGFDKNGKLIVNDQECDNSEGTKARLVCTRCETDFPLPANIEFRNTLEE